MIAYGSPGLDDWPLLRSFWEKFKAGRHADRIVVSEGELTQYFLASLVQPHIFGVLWGWQDGILRGVVVMKGVVVEQNGVNQAASYIVGAYVLPRTDRAFCDGLHQQMDQWSRARQHRFWRAHARAPVAGANNYKLKAIDKRYGFKVACIVLERELEEVV
jgi:type IV secretory pathway VirB3-like protein